MAATATDLRPTSTAASTPSVTATRSPKFLWTGALAGLVAGVAASTVAAVAQAGGGSLAVGGTDIPIVGFAQMTFVFTMVGAILAVVLAHNGRSPRRTFVRTTVALTILSFVPDVIADAATGTKLTLMLTHVVAAAIAIPALSARFTD